MKLNKEGFKPALDTWYNKLESLFDNDTMDGIYTYIKDRSSKGHKVLPGASNVFRAFRECPYNDIKLCILGMSPYHSVINSTVVADGIALSCSNTGIMQPSLKQWYNEIQKTMPEYRNILYLPSPDLTFLAKQGVLMINAALTCEIGKANAHIELWKPFMSYLFKEIISLTGVPVLFLGKEAAEYVKYLPFDQFALQISHPASASYKNEDWDCEECFHQISEHLMQTNGTKIEWIEKKLTELYE